MKTRFLLLLVLWCALSCQNANETGSIAFDPAKWQTKKEADYPYRNDMLTDLIGSDTLKQLNKAQVLELLGKPDRTDGNYSFYTISQERVQFFPLHTKTMVILCADDGTVQWVKIHE